MRMWGPATNHQTAVYTASDSGLSLFRILPVAMVTLFVADTVTASADVILILGNGKPVIADRIDRQTNSVRIVVRREAPGIVITRRLPWQQVQSARIDGRRVSPDELRRMFITDGRRQQPTGDDPFVSEDRTQPPPARQDPFYSVEPPSEDWFEPPQLVPVEEVAAFGCCNRASVYFPAAMLPPAGTIIGVRAGPLSAYGASVARYFPHGVPLSETAFALELMRAKKVEQVFGPQGNHVPWRVPPPKRLPPRPLSQIDYRPEPIRAISIDAFPISSRGKVDWDSLALEVVGLDRFGQPTPVRGTLRVTLWGRTQWLFPAEPRFYNRLAPKPPTIIVPLDVSAGRIKRVATWTRRIELNPRVGLGDAPLFSPTRNDIRVVQSAAGPLTRLVLPLPHPLPDHNLRLDAFGELHVQLLVPGEGTLEAIQSDIALRHRSLLRDQLLVETGSRFFRQEGTAGSRIPTRPRPDDRFRLTTR